MMVIVNLLGCGAPSNGPTTSVQLTIERPSSKIQKARSAPAFSFIQMFVITVTGPNINKPIVGFMSGFSAGQRISESSLDIPNGENRLFVVEGKDSSGNVIFKGSATKNLDGTATELAIIITPFEFTKIFFTPVAATSTPVGETFSREVEIFDLKDAFYTGFSISYDPNILEYLGSKESGFFSQDGKPTFFQEALQNGKQGKVTIGITRIGKSETVKGSGKLITLSFKAIAAGNSPLAFTNPRTFRNRAHEDVRVNDWEDGSVIITQ
jgi:hypothetical protein